jgi:hypothetical protein
MRQKFVVRTDRGYADYGLGSTGLSLAARYGAGLIAVAVAVLGLSNVYSAMMTGSEPGTVVDGMAGTLLGVGNVGPVKPQPPQTVGLAPVGAADMAFADRSAVPQSQPAAPVVGPGAAAAAQSEAPKVAEAPTPAEPPKRSEKPRSTKKKYTRNAPAGRPFAQYADRGDFDWWNGSAGRPGRRIHVARPWQFDSPF